MFMSVVIAQHVTWVIYKMNSHLSGFVWPFVFSHLVSFVVFCSLKNDVTIVEWHMHKELLIIIINSVIINSVMNSVIYYCNE